MFPDNTAGLYPGYSIPVIVGGSSYQILTNNRFVKLDSSNGKAPVAVMPQPSYIGERHTLWWWNWDNTQIPPQITSDNNHKMVPFTGMAGGGNAGLVTQTSITNTGGMVTYEWDGSEWVTV